MALDRQWLMLGAAIVGSNSDRDYYNHHRNDRGWRNRCRASPRIVARRNPFVSGAIMSIGAAGSCAS